MSMHTYMPGDSIFDGPVTNLFSMLNILIEIFSCADTKEEKILMASSLAILLVVFRVTAQQA